MRRYGSAGRTIICLSARGWLKEDRKLVVSGPSTNFFQKFVSAYTQLCSLQLCPERNPDTKKRYEATLKTDLQNEQVRQSSSRSDPQWYLPHHPVINPNDPEKVRRVRNAACKFEWQINDGTKRLVKSFDSEKAAVLRQETSRHYSSKWSAFRWKRSISISPERRFHQGSRSIRVHTTCRSETFSNMCDLCNATNWVR